MNKITWCILFVGSLLMAQPGPDDGVSFNGVDQFLIMPDSDNINTRSVRNRTIEAWFKVDDATNRQVFYKEGAQVNTIKFYVEGGNLVVGSYRDSGGPGESVWFRTAISNNTWYHVALVLEEASSLLFYLDGQLVAENNDYFELPRHPGNFEIARTQGPARYPNCSLWPITGSVAECLGEVTNTDNIQLFYAGRIFGFRIWDDVRSAQEISDNLNVLITDPQSPQGEDLIAFLDGYTMTFKDNRDNFSQEEAQGVELSIPELSKMEIRIVQNEFEIRILNSEDRVPEQMVLFDLLGKQVKTVSNRNKISKQYLNSGVYILRIKDAGRIINKKVLIKN